jgi:hypothetical protein
VAKVAEDKSGDSLTETSILGYTETPVVFPAGDWYPGQDQLIQRVPIYGDAPADAQVYKKKVVKTKTVAAGVVDVVDDQSMYYWHRNDQVELQSGAWCLAEIPKNFFVRYGSDTTLDWSDVKAVRYKATTSGGAVNLYFDDLKIVGGGQLRGDYWFMYAYGRRTTAGALEGWSSVARSGTTVIIRGPVSFNRQQVTYTGRPISSDSQVNCGLVYMLGGNLTDWRLAYTITDNTTTTDTIDITEEDANRLGVAFRNEPAPAGEDIIYKWGRLWICGLQNYPAGIACSEITADGDVLLDAWNPINVWIAEGEKKLVSLSDFSSQNVLVVRGHNGEYQLGMADPADITTVQPLNKISSYGVLNGVSKVPFEDGELYPSTKSFVMGTAAGSKAVLPEFSSVITESNMADAVGVTTGWVSYFSFTDHNGTDRLIKADHLRESLRVGTVSNLKCDCLALHPTSKRVYGLYNGSVYSVEVGYNGTEYDLNLVSRGYTAEGGIQVAWQCIEFQHNTGNQWLRCHVLIDGSQVGYLPFRSTRSVTTRYWFGPLRGSYLQFSFKGQYVSGIEIQLPIRIYYG